jgi:hypothetical protein
MHHLRKVNEKDVLLFIPGHGVGLGLNLRRNGLVPFVDAEQQLSQVGSWVDATHWMAKANVVGHVAQDSVCLN